MGNNMGVRLKFAIENTHLNLISELDQFKGRWNATQAIAPDRLQVLLRVATIESIGSSTRIEGAKLSDSEIERLLSGLDIFSFRSRDEQEVAGYSEAMELVFSAFAEMPLTENNIKQLHGVLLKHSQKDQRHRGEYKKFPNHLEAFDASGKSLGVVFETASPFETPKKTEDLVNWTHSALEQREVHPLFVVAYFIVEFLAIHPFQDGNGRLSRVLTTLLLLRAGYSYVPYSSLERVIEGNKDQYYLALRKAQGNPAKLGEWVTFFLQSMVKQKTELERKLAQEKLVEQLPELSSQILAYIRDRGRASNSELVAITRSNRNTVKKHLQDLVKAGRLLSQGKGKGTWYKQP